MLRLAPKYLKRLERDYSGRQAECHQQCSGRSAKPPSGRYLSFAEREEIALLAGARLQCTRGGASARTSSLNDLPGAAAQRRHPQWRSGISRTTAQWHAERSARRPKQAQLVLNRALRAYVRGSAGRDWSRLPSGTPVRWPVRTLERAPSWTAAGSSMGTAWSPEQIARRLPVDFPNDITMRISHEAIYQALVHPRSRRATSRTDGMSAHRAGAANAESARASARQELRIVRDHDQPTPGRGRRPCGARTLGG